MDPSTAITVLSAGISVARRIKAFVDNETSDSEKIDELRNAPYKTALTQLRDATLSDGDPSHHLQRALNSFDTAQHQGEPRARAHAMFGRALCLQLLGDHAPAAAAIEDVLNMRRDEGDFERAVRKLRDFAKVAGPLGRKPTIALAVAVQTTPGVGALAANWFVEARDARWQPVADLQAAVVAALGETAATRRAQLGRLTSLDVDMPAP